MRVSTKRGVDEKQRRRNGNVCGNTRVSGGDAVRDDLITISTPVDKRHYHRVRCNRYHSSGATNFQKSGSADLRTYSVGSAAY